MVIGDGPMGLLHVQAIRSFGASKVIVSGMTEHRLAVAEYFADHVINAKKKDVKAEVLLQTNGLGPDVVIVAVASVDAAKEAMDIVRPGGAVLLFGGFATGSELTINPNRVHYNEVSVLGSVGSMPQDFSLALRILEMRKVESDKIISHRYSLDKVPLALELGGKQKGIKAVVDPWAPEETAETLK